MKKNTAFTLVELVIAVTILVILTAIWFISYSSYTSNARDTQRISDIALITSKLNGRIWKYPTPWTGTYFTGDLLRIRYNTNYLAMQWELNAKVASLGLENIPLDPKMKHPYIYSITADWREYQVAATLENPKLIALVKWNYKSVSVYNLPSLIIASNGWDWEISPDNNKRYFVLDGQTVNIPYSVKEGEPTSANGFSDLRGAIDALVEENLYYKSSDYRSCDEIKNAGKYMTWITEYQLYNWEILTNTECF
jgi:hypothetical protein